MGNEECLKALRAFIKAFHSYLKKNAGRTISIASLTGQKKVKVSVRALMREHDPLTGFPLFMNVLETLNTCSFEGFKKRGIIFEVIDGEIYINIPLNILREVKDMNEEELIKYFR